jgi:hypothetical protein
MTSPTASDARGPAALLLAGLCACAGGGATTDDASTGPGPTTPSTDPDLTTTAPSPTTGDPDTTAAPTTATTGTTAADTGTADSTGPGGCDACIAPNQQCVDGECVTLCQGQDPDPCGPDQVCDVISGACKDPDAACVLAGPAVDCGAARCGPGSVCDGQGACVPIAPCADVACTAAQDCWGRLCACERPSECDDPALELLNGPFSSEITALDFADDCTAWMVTLRSGTDYLRRLRPDGEVTEWPGVSNLDMGEVKVLRSLTVPQLTRPYPFAGLPAPPEPVEGIGEVALTYTCCENCGCFSDPPQGVARLVEDDPDTPLPLVIVAQVTQGTGPFGEAVADAGPQGLTWGVDRVLYVGNSTANGDYNTADLPSMTQAAVTSFPARVTASAPVSPVHLVVGLIGGEVQRLNVATAAAELVVDLGADITSFSHDRFTGKVYAGLSTLEIVAFDPFTGEVEGFAVMPGKGRVAVSPSGALYFAPVKYLEDGVIVAWDLPDAL